MLELNQDCWREVLHHLSTDYRSLGRVLQTSSANFKLVVPVVYSGLFDPKEPGHQRGWSKKKSHRLLSMLLFSYGLLDQYGYISQKIAYRPEDDNEIIMVDGMMDFKFSTSTTINYFCLLKNSPRLLSRRMIWKNKLGQRISVDELETRKEYVNQTQQLEWQFAPLCRILNLRVCDVETLLTKVQIYKQLHQISLDFLEEEFDKQSLDTVLSFIRIHKMLFPGILQKVDGVPRTYALRTFQLLEPSEMWVVVNRWGSDLRKDGTWDWLSRLERLVCWPCGPDDDVLSFIHHSPNLKVLAVHGAVGRSPLKLFRWGPDEQLPPIRDLTLKYSFMHSAKDALRLFKHTLERVTFQNVSWLTSATSVDWKDWTPPNLSYLEIISVEVDLSQLAFCSKLKVLKWDCRDLKVVTPWKLPPSIVELRVMGEASLLMDKSSLQATAGRLQKLELACRPTILTEENMADTDLLVSLTTSDWVKWPVFQCLEVIRFESVVIQYLAPMLEKAPNLRHLTAGIFGTGMHQNRWLDSLFKSFQEIGSTSRLEILDLGITDGSSTIVLWLAANSEISSMAFPNLRAIGCGNWGPHSNGQDIEKSQNEHEALEILMSRPKMEIVQVGAMPELINQDDFVKIDNLEDFSGRKVFPMRLDDEIAGNGFHDFFCTIVTYDANDTRFGKRRFSKRKIIAKTI